MTRSPLRTLALAGLAALSAPAAHAAGDFAACFSLKPGTVFYMQDSKIEIARERFGQRDAIAVIQTDEGVRSKQLYSADGRSHYGSVRYGIAAFGGDPDAPIMTDAYDPAPQFPAKASPGGSFKIAGRGQRTQHGLEGGDEVEEIAYEGFSDFTFVGFEDLSLEVDGKPRTFAGTCRLKAGEGDTSLERWYAPGFGMIQFQRYSGDSVVYSRSLSRVEKE